MSYLYFSQEFHSIHHFLQTFILVGADFVCGLRKFSNFILIFVSEGTLTVAVTHVHPKHQWRRAPLSAHLLQHCLFAECMATAIPPGVV